MKKIGLLLALVLGAAVAYAQQRSFDEKIVYMMELSGVKRNMEMVLENAIERQKKLYGANYNHDFWEEMEKEMKSKDFDDLVGKLVPVYKKHLSEEDVDGIIAFYESEAGQHLISRSPLILAECMDIGAAWGGEIGIMVQEKIQNNSKTRFNTTYEGCGAFHDGVFQYSTGYDSLVVDVVRKGNLQTEVFQGNTSYYRIEWLDDCRYTMYSIDENGRRLARENEVFTVNIVSIEGNRCSYVVYMPGIDKYDENEMIKLK